MMKKNGFSLILYFLFSFQAFAQTEGFKAFCKLAPVTSSGFYNIDIKPEVNAFLKKDYSDLRVVNDAGKWIPHLLHNPADEITIETVNWDLKYNLLENNKKNTILVIENSRDTISNIGLVIGNTSATRFCRISGSNDQKSWFVINDSILISPTLIDNNTQTFFRINFPQVNYPFFKIWIINNNKDPLAIKRAVNTAKPAVLNTARYKMAENPNTLIQQKDSGKISYLTITQQHPFHFDQLRIQVSGVQYFNRIADVYVPYNGEGSLSNPGLLVQRIALSNNSNLQFNLPLSKSKVFYIFIHNEDNLPLRAEYVKTYYSNRYITTYLEAGKAYRLLLENMLAYLPDYDLVNLKTQIPDSVSLLACGSPVLFSVSNNAAEKSNFNKWMLWIAIGSALVVLLFFTTKMIKEVDKNKES